jgi:hypothetical protein
MASNDCADQARERTREAHRGWQVLGYGPLIDRTHQAWKLYTANVSVVVALVVHAVPRWLLHGTPSRAIAAFAGVSAAIAAFSVYLFFRAVRCPVCGAKWVWRAVRQRPGRWLDWLREQQVCPVCGSNGEALAQDRRAEP